VTSRVGAFGMWSIPAAKAVGSKMVFCIAVKGRARLGGPGQAFGLQPALGPFGQAAVAEQAPGDGGGVEAVDAGQPVG
jgi:hypothetical protein